MVSETSEAEVDMDILLISFQYSCNSFRLEYLVMINLSRVFAADFDKFFFSTDFTASRVAFELELAMNSR